MVTNSGLWHGIPQEMILWSVSITRCSTASCRLVLSAARNGKTSVYLRHLTEESLLLEIRCLKEESVIVLKIGLKKENNDVRLIIANQLEHSGDQAVQLLFFYPTGLQCT